MQVESQRLLLWATRLGKAEELMTELNKRHFERRQSVNARAALLEAVEATEGLDVAAASAFLDTNELEDEVRALSRRQYKHHSKRSVRRMLLLEVSYTTRAKV